MLKRHGPPLAHAALLVAAIAAPALAQQPPLGPDLERPRDNVPDLREPEFAPPERPRFELPPLPPAPPGGLGSGQTVFVRDVVVGGNTALPTARLEEIARPYEGREVALEELFRLKDELTLAYVNAGYVNSGAVLPDQEVRDGVVRFGIVEGRLETVEITGTRQLSARYLEARVRRGAGRPLDIVALQDRLQLLLLDPTIERLDARLLPGSAPGQARLEVAVEEAPRRFSVELGAANDQSPSIGGTRGELAVVWRNLLGRGDPLRLAVRGSEGLREVGFGYSVPLTSRDLRVRIEGEASEADIVDDEVEDLDIESSSRSLTLGLSMPVYETVANRIGLDLAFTRERNRTYLLDEPFAFSPGTDQGRTDLTLLRFTQDWLHRGRSRAVSAASTFTIGLDALGATDNDGDPDGQFLAWLGQGEVVQRVFTDTDALAVRGTLQLADDPLLASEQFALGGLGSVRGYRINELVRDQGWALSAEYRLPVLPWLLRRLYPEPAPRPPEGASLELVPLFVDAGGAWNHDGADLEDDDADTLLSVGIGLRGAFRWVSAEVYWGLPLTDRDGSSEDALQDAGVGFRVGLRLY